MNDAIVHFTIGSSLFMTIYPCLFLHYGSSQADPRDLETSLVSPPMLMYCTPVIFGALFAFMYAYMGFVPRKYNDFYVRYVVAATAASFVMSILYHYVLHVQDRWFGMEHPEMSHIVVPLFYAGLFSTIGLWLRSQILYGPSPTSSSSSSSSSGSSSGSVLTPSSVPSSIPVGFPGGFPAGLGSPGRPTTYDLLAQQSGK